MCNLSAEEIVDICNAIRVWQVTNTDTRTMQQVIRDALDGKPIEKTEARCVEGFVG